MIDGYISCIVVEFSYMLKISLNILFGIKVKFLGIVDIKNGFLFLNDFNIIVFGGEVEYFIEKWEL